MSGWRVIAGHCRFCGCSGDSCRLPSGGGDRCTWLDLGRTVCSAPACLRRHSDAARAAQGKRRKRTPGEIHALMQQERRERRREARARKKGKAA